MLFMSFQPTVDIGSNNDLIIKLPDFRNVLGKTNIHLTGADANLVKDSKAQWDEVTYTLTIKIAARVTVRKNTRLSLSVQESQGFILPANLHRNDPRLRVSSVNNILEEFLLGRCNSVFFSLSHLALRFGRRVSKWTVRICP